jgi:hypothetical protein
LILPVPHVLRVQGGLIFSDLRILFGGHFMYKLVHYNL